MKATDTSFGLSVFVRMNIPIKDTVCPITTSELLIAICCNPMNTFPIILNINVVPTSAKEIISIFFKSGTVNWETFRIL